MDTTSAIEKAILIDKCNRTLTFVGERTKELCVERIEATTTGDIIFTAINESPFFSLLPTSSEVYEALLILHNIPYEKVEKGNKILFKRL